MRTETGPFAGPGCGVDEHPADCLCDVVLPGKPCPSGRNPRKAKQQTLAILRSLDAPAA